MSSRFLIAVLCLGAVALACGPRAHNEASTPKKDSATVVLSASIAQQKPATAARATASKSGRAPAKPAVEGQLYVHAGESSIRLALHVVNTTKKRLELTFPSGQLYEFVILDSLDREVWRWGKGRMFTQTVRNKLLSGGDTMNLEETWAPSATVAPGRYTARGVLTSQNYPVVRQAEFTIEPTTIASR